MTRKNIGRRSLLKALSAGAAGIIGMSSASAASASNTGQLDWENIEANVAETVGSAEASIVVSIARSYEEQVQAGKLTPQEAYKNATYRILEHPDTEIATTVIQDSTRETETTASDIPVMSLASSKHETVHCGSAIEEKNAEFNAEAYTYYKDNDNYIRIKELTNTAGYGSAQTRIFAYGIYTAPVTGTYEVGGSYFRRGKVGGGGNTEFSFVADDGTNLQRETVEVVSTGHVEGRVTARRFITLVEGRTYRIGFEVRGNSSTAGSATYTDFRESDYDLDPRKVDLTNGYVEVEYIE